MDSNTKCSNCGGTDRVRSKMIVPATSGGFNVEGNMVALCRPCDLASEAHLTPKAEQPRRLVNFWVSRSLYEWMQGETGFDSMGALVRYLMSKYVVDETRYDDLENYQDAGSDVKINVWVESESYQVFKDLVDRRGMSVTDAFKSLLRMYEAQTAPTVEIEG
jgi:hypothetical protein